MNSEYKSGNSVAQVLVALVATILVGSVALVGTVGPAIAAPTRIVATA
jgi:hypothetical protein